MRPLGIFKNDQLARVYTKGHIYVNKIGAPRAVLDGSVFHPKARITPWSKVPKCCAQ